MDMDKQGGEENKSVGSERMPARLRTGKTARDFL
jgi:hypothetical protein